MGPTALIRSGLNLAPVALVLIADPQIAAALKNKALKEEVNSSNRDLIYNKVTLFKKPNQGSYQVHHHLLLPK